MSLRLWIESLRTTRLRAGDRLQQTAACAAGPQGAGLDQKTAKELPEKVVAWKGLKMVSSAGLAVIWDVDGTLVDTAELHYRAWVQLAKELQKPFTRADFVATFGRRNPEILRQLFGNHLSDREVAELGDRKEDLYRAAARHGVELLPGVRQLLDGLH